MYPRISINPEVCHGQACIKGTRIPVHQIIHTLANGGTIEERPTEYPSLEPEDILTCIDYASLDEERITLIEALASTA